MAFEQAKATANSLNQRTFAALDNYYPPSRRSEHFNTAQTWISEHPVLSAFILVQVVMSGLPLFLFLFISGTVFSVLLTVFLGIAITLSAATVGFLSLFFLPVLFVTSSLATGFFLAGLISYLGVQKFSNDPRTEGIRSKTKDNYFAAIQAAQDTTQKAANKAQQAALNAAAKANEISNGQLEQSLADGKKALEQQRSNGVATQVPPSIHAHSNVVPTSVPVQANTNGSDGHVASAAPQRGPDQIAQVVTQARVSSRPALF